MWETGSRLNEDVIISSCTCLADFRRKQKTKITISISVSDKIAL